MKQKTFVSIAYENKKKEMRREGFCGRWIRLFPGIDRSGLTHTVEVTMAKRHDITESPNLVREDDRAVFGDKGYFSGHC